MLGEENAFLSHQLMAPPEVPDQEMALVPFDEGVLAIRGRPPPMSLTRPMSAELQNPPRMMPMMSESSPPQGMAQRVTRTYTQISEGSAPVFGQKF